MVSNKEKANTLATNFARAHNNILRSDQRTVEEVNHTMEVLADSNEMNLDPSTLAKPTEIKEIIKRLKSKKSPGQDGIRNALLKHLPRKGLVYLTKIFNGCIRLMYFPSMWKHAIVVAIPKPKKDVTLPTNYRPISLLSSLSKVLERIILNRLNRHLDTNAVIPNEQFGFKAGHSTNHQLTRIRKIVKEGFVTKKSTGMIMLDVEKAYDSVWQEAIIYKLHRSNCPLYIVKLIQSFLLERTFQVSVNECRSEKFDIPCGVPQGSVLSPTLYNVFTSDVLMVDGVTYAFFADDTAFLVSDVDPRIISCKLQHAQNKLEEFQQKWRIKTNAAKTQAIFFTRKRAPRHLPATELSVNGIRIPWKNEACYLGLTMDEKLLFDKHINSSINKVNGLTRSMYSLINRRSSLQLANKLLTSVCSGQSSPTAAQCGKVVLCPI
ncbi:hypothetical protein RP20_CCG017824 [Aedes albopictus]|nr:hypothetical protein RP20_CCG017824 [Aedes albopictus]